MKKAEIKSKKEIQKDLGDPAFVSAYKTNDRMAVYIPVGELYGVKILIKHKVQKRGEYLILE